MQAKLFPQKIKSYSVLFCALVAAICFALTLTSCASSQRRVFVYGFGNMTVPQNATIEDINGLVRDTYGADLFWSPR